MRRPGAALLAVLALLLALPAAAAAQQPAPGAVSVVPAAGSPYADGARLVARGLRPGSVITDSVVVVNAADTPVRVAVYAADGQPAAGGGFGFTERGASNVEVGAWTSLSRDEVELPARGTAVVDLELVVGAGAFDGVNVGAIVAEPLDQEQTGQLPSRTRYAMPVTVVVVDGRPRPSPGPDGSGADGPAAGPGARPVQLAALEPGARGGRYCPTVALGNAGSAGGSVTLTTEVDGLLSGRTSRSTQVDLPPAASARRVELGCLARPLGPARVQVSVDGTDDQSLGDDVFWAPWPVYVSLLFLLLLIGALVTTFVRGLLRRRERTAPPPTATSHS